MAWQKGSIGGVKFFTVRHSTTVGRREGLYEIPFDDKGAASIDLGRAARKYQIDAVLLGDDAEAQADKLLKVIEKKGPKLLVHPRFGSGNVVCGKDVEFTEDTDATNQVTISFRCTEHREPAAKTPALGALTRPALAKASADLGSAIGDAFEAGLSANDLVDDFVNAANIEVLDEILGDLQDINADITAVLSAPGAIAGKIDAISRELSELIQSPRKLFDAIDGAMLLLAQAARRILPGSASDSIGSVERAALAMSALGSGAAPIPDFDTPSRAVQRSNQAAIQLNMRSNGLRHMAEAAADDDSNYDSSTQAKRIARSMAGAMDSVLESTENDQELAPSVRRAMIRMRTATQRHIAAKAGLLPELTQYTPGETLPACVIAYGLYGDSDRASEIVARNGIEHPGFVPGGIALEVLGE